MGRRSRKRGGPSPVSAPAPSAPRAARASRHRAPTKEAPKPPWAPFPLVEVLIVTGLVFVVIGLVMGEGQGRTVLGFGIAVICVASLEVAIREHITGFRSHSMLLALLPTAIAVAISWFAAELTAVVRLGITVAVFLISFLALREVFRRRSGGLSFRA